MFARLLGVTVVTTWTTLLSASTLMASASADPCPDIEVTFARGTDEPPGVGGVGQEFIDSLRSQVRGRSVGVYPVNYPAGDDVAPSASAGAVDAHAHVAIHGCELSQHQAGARRIFPGRGCDRSDHHLPSTDFGLDAGHPDGGRGGSRCCLALFGNPSDRILGAPVNVVSDWYGAKAIDLCAPGDPVCTPGGPALTLPSHEELFSPAHLSYQQSGMPGQAATFVASHL